MDMVGQDKFELEKGNEAPINYHSPNMSSDWQFSTTNLSNISMGLIPTGNPMAVCKGDVLESSSCSSASMADSFCPTIWDQPTNSQTLGFCDISVQNNVSTVHTLGILKGGLGHPRAGIERTLDMGIFLPTASRLLPPSVSQFPADSGFIERAARLSSFGCGNFSDMMNPFIIPESISPYSRGVAAMEATSVGFAGSVLKSIAGGQSQKNEMKDVSMSFEHGATEGSLLKNESFVRSHDEAKQGVDGSGNESDEAEFSGGDGQEEPLILDGIGSAKGLGSKKRKRSGQDTELDQIKGTPPQPLAEATKDNTEIQQNPTSIAYKPSGKHGKQGSQVSDSLKEEYIHVRARRGQATNSHSLAERVRREKISERMKFLQELVPGCSKVTGKAVMLDEIINYVQSLQRQVEFLSMKLATVNPRLDFNIEGLLAKDVLQSRAGPSSTLGFRTDMPIPYPPLHPSQPPGLIRASLPGMGNSSDATRRTINSHLTAINGGYKEPTSQVPNVWEDELHNIVHMMDFNSSAPLSCQDLSGSLPPGHTKVEP